MTERSYIRKLEHFGLVEEIGRGGYSQVFKAFDEKLQRYVALKLLAPKNETSDEISKRFDLESIAAARLDHPNVVRVNETGELDQQRFISYELVEGVSLREWNRFTAPNREDVCRILVSICRGVAAAHTQGIVHRDLKPENILVDVSGQPKVTDFGLASLPEHRLTSNDVTLGTVAYMSPEQAKGQSNISDFRSDVFSLGVIGFEAVVGRLPFQATTHSEYLASLCNKEIQPVSTVCDSIPIDLASIIDKCLSREPIYRYGNAGDLANDLEKFLDGNETAARPLTQTARAFRVLRRHYVLSILATSVALIVFISVFVAVRFSRTADEGTKREVQLVVENICDANTKALLPFLEKSTVNAKELIPVLQKRHDDENNLDTLFNLTVALLELSGYSDSNLEHIVEQCHHLSPSQFSLLVDRLWLLDKSTQRASIESIIRRQNGFHKSGRLSFLSLVAGTGHQGDVAAEIDGDQRDRHQLINCVSELTNADSMLNELLNAKRTSINVRPCLLTGIAEWSRLGADLRGRVKVDAASQNVRIRAAAYYIAKKHQVSIDYRALDFLTPFPRKCDWIAPVRINQEKTIGVWSTELTLEQVKQFENDARIAKILNRLKHEFGNRVVGRGKPTLDRPLVSLSIDEMKTICNAMSEVAGLPVAYTGGKAVSNSTGFRLPTFDEWVVYSSCNAQTDLFCGSISEIGKYVVALDQFSVTVPEALTPMERRPSSFGLFDVFGNVTEIAFDSENVPLQVGGHTWQPTGEFSATQRVEFPNPGLVTGFRVVRTFSPEEVKKYDSSR